MLGYGLWHQSCGWPWETCTGDDCQDSRWKKFGLMHGCASPSLFCSVFIWRGGFAPSLRCNGTVFLVYLKCFLTVVLEQGQFWRIVWVMTWGRHAFVFIWSLWNCSDLPNAFERRQHAVWVRQSYWLRMHANAVSSLQSYLQCHIYTQFILNHHDCLKLEYGDVSHMTIYITGVFADFAPRTLMREGSETPRNEARRIRETILSVMDAADMAVILDTGSSDGTQNIIKEATWQNSAFPTFLKPIFLLTASI